MTNFGRASTGLSINPASHLRALFTLLLLALLFTQARATQVELNGPPGSGGFGTHVVVLPNGNIVVSDPNFDEGGVPDIGAAYLYDGATLALISTLKGSAANDRVGGVITVLANGNYVVSHTAWDNGSVTNAGALTFCRATTGCNGVVSPANSLVGSSAFDFLGGFVTPLPNGNYIVHTMDWDTYFPPVRQNVGAVTFCSGTTGCAGPVTTSNSLIGSTAEDRIGTPGITVLKDGDYVVNSRNWDNFPYTDVGAVTFCSGTTGCGGVVSPSNSLVGQRHNEAIGSIPGPRNGVVGLANGNYVVASGFYNPNSVNNPNPYGAVTFCNGVTGCAGTVTSNVSLTGSGNAQSVGGNGVTALPNGNYVVNSPHWDNGFGADTGAVTFCNGTTGCSGTVHSGNSLLGSKPFDYVGNLGAPGTTDLFNPVTVLSDGNYVVSSPNWDNGAAADVGAVTWCSGVTGCAGPVSPFNSLVGATANDRIGNGSFPRGVHALRDGNYVVNSPLWNNPSLGTVDVGAVTFCNGAANSCANTVVSSANSLTGSTAGDFIGSGGTTALPSGNYVVASSVWDNGAVANAGALTFCGGAAGCTGTVSPANSLVGSNTNDLLNGFVVALPGGAYAAVSRDWDNGAATDAGAVTFCDGASGCAGPISPSTSLVGSRASDQVGSNGVTVLLSGNYVVSSPNWDNGATADAGAVTFCNGTAGCSGVISASNSLVGSTAADRVGSTSRLLNGNYVVQSASWDNGATANAGAVTFGDGTGGTVGAISPDNSVLGTASTSGNLSFSYDAVRNRLFVGRRASNVVSILFFETNAVADGNLGDGATWSDGVPGALTNANIPAGRTVTVNTDATIGGLSVAGGANLVMNAGLRLTGSLALGTRVDTGAHRLALSCTSGVAGGAPPHYVVGNLEKNFCTEGAFSYPTGTASGYSPVVVTVTALGVIPSSLTVRTVQGNRAGMDPAQSARRYWTLTEAGDLTTNLSFNYLDGDVSGDESSYKLYKWEGAQATLVPGVLDAGGNTVSAAGVADFSDWAIGSPGSSSPPDGDGDGAADDVDNCPAAANPGQEDADADGDGDACDPDDDNDGQSDADEVACGSDPLNAGSKAADADGDNRPDCADPDDDGDGVPDATDNCPLATNANQADADGDHIGDACDPTPHGDGQIVFSSNRDGNFEIYRMSADGTGAVRLTNNAAADLDPALSPDRSKVVFTSTRDGDLEIYSMNADGTGLARLTNHVGDDAYPAWSPDGSRVVFTSERDGNPEIYTMGADGTGPVRLTNHDATDAFPAWSPDGSRIAFSSTRGGSPEIYTMNADGTGLARLTGRSCEEGGDPSSPFEEDVCPPWTPAEDIYPAWSPDGSRIAFMSDRAGGDSGSFDIYTMKADGTDLVRLTSDTWDDAFPAWSPDGSKIVFTSTRDGNSEIYTMNVVVAGLTRLTTNSASDISPHW